MKLAASLVATVVLGSAATPASSLCIYNGVDNAKTSIPQEFRDSSWVVRARVISAKDHWSDSEDSWTTYDLETLHAYKGHPPKHLEFFTYRDSGGFYMDRPWVKLTAGHDIGGQYLLFFNPVSTQPNSAAPKDAVLVNYSCGVSGPWSAVSSSSRQTLVVLSQSR